MAVRNLLHKSKLNAFEAWLNSKGYETAEPKSYWEVLRAKKGNRTVIVYRKANAKEHYTLMDRDYHMYRQFLKDTKLKPCPNFGSLNTHERERTNESDSE